MPAKRNGLSSRELQVRSLVASGLRSREIADRLEISVRTVEKHRENIGKKLGAPLARPRRR